MTPKKPYTPRAMRAIPNQYPPDDGGGLVKFEVDGRCYQTFACFEGGLEPSQKAQLIGAAISDNCGCGLSKSDLAAALANLPAPLPDEIQEIRKLLNEIELKLYTLAKRTKRK